MILWVLPWSDTMYDLPGMHFPVHLPETTPSILAATTTYQKEFRRLAVAISHIPPATRFS